MVLVQYTADLYDTKFFAEIAPASRRAAEVVVPLLVERVRPRRVLDLGCATGQWLAPFLPDAAVLGIDLPSVPRELLAIPADRFLACDVVQDDFPLLEQDFDLALCLETAEHLPEALGPLLVRWLTLYAPVIFFGAAVPQQNGCGHINEQPHAYWEKLFDRAGFSVETTLEQMLGHHCMQVPDYYTKNTKLFVRKQ